MFKQKHVFTCPDVIYLMDRQKKLNRIALAINGLFFGGLFVSAKIAERQMDQRRKNLQSVPTETPTE